MDINALERDIRAIAGVVSCAVTDAGVNVLVEAGADPRAVESQARAVVARHGGPPLHLLVPATAAAPRRSRSKLALALVGASAAMTAAVVPFAFRSLPPTPQLQLREAPEPPRTLPEVSAPGSVGTPKAPRPLSPVVSAGSRRPSTSRPGGSIAPAAPVTKPPAVPPVIEEPPVVPEECNGHHAYGYYAKPHDDRGLHLGHSCVNDSRP